MILLRHAHTLNKIKLVTVTVWKTKTEKFRQITFFVINFFFECSPEDDYMEITLYLPQFKLSTPKWSEWPINRENTKPIKLAAEWETTLKWGTVKMPQSWSGDSCYVGCAELPRNYWLHPQNGSEVTQAETSECRVALPACSSDSQSVVCGPLVGCTHTSGDPWLTVIMSAK